MTWAQESFLRAEGGRITPVNTNGYVYRGLGLFERKPNIWDLFHLGTGHLIFKNIQGKRSDVFSITTEIANMTDWSFDGLNGWKNTDPELPEKMAKIMGRHRRLSKVQGLPLPDVALQITLKRAALVPEEQRPGWEFGTFLCAEMNRPISKIGYIYNGLSMHKTSSNEWNLTHLGTGHLVCTIREKDENAFPIATEIAKLTDWSFDGLEGWKNIDPSLSAKMEEIMNRYQNVSKSDRPMSDHNVAKRIAIIRAGTTGQIPAP